MQTTDRVKKKVRLRGRSDTLGFMDARELKGFTDWLARRGRGDGTQQLYRSHVRSALAEGPARWLLDRKRAPKTRRAGLAALRAWGRYRGDTKLLEDLSDIKLPAPTRKTPRIPLERDKWLELIECVDHSRLPDELRATLGMVVVRGFRVGDVLRVKRSEVNEALKSGILGYLGKGEKRLEFRVATFRKYLEMLTAHRGAWERVADLVSPSADPKTRQKAAVKRIERILKTVAKGAGIAPKDIYPHRLRRTAAVQYLQKMQGDPEALLKLKEWMGWADLNTTAGYADHIRREDLAEVEDRLYDK